MNLFLDFITRIVGKLGSGDRGLVIWFHLLVRIKKLDQTRPASNNYALKSCEPNAVRTREPLERSNFLTGCLLIVGQTGLNLSRILAGLRYLG